VETGNVRGRRIDIDLMGTQVHPDARTRVKRLKGFGDDGGAVPEGHVVDAKAGHVSLLRMVVA
jgi:hypothetical protein